MLPELLKNKMIAHFRGIDIDKNGFVELEDLERIADNFAKIRGWKADSPEYKNLHSTFVYMWEKYWVSADLNKDNKVSLDEFLKSCTTQFALDNESSVPAWAEWVKDLFPIIDRDGDNKIGQSEYNEFLIAYEFNADGYEEIFQALDANGDGYISLEEFSQLLKEYIGVNPEAAGNLLFGYYWYRESFNTVQLSLKVM